MEGKPEPTYIGPEVEYAVRRTAALTEHADTVLDIREHHARCGLEMIAHEARINVFDGFSPRLLVGLFSGPRNGSDAKNLLAMIHQSQRESES